MPSRHPDKPKGWAFLPQVGSRRISGSGIWFWRVGMNCESAEAALRRLPSRRRHKNMVAYA